MYSKELPRN